MNQTIEISLEGIHVMIGMPAHRDLPIWTSKSLLSTQELLIRQNVSQAHGFVIGCSVVQKARDEVVQMFMESTCSHLFWVDSDMVWEAQDFLRTLAISDKVGVCCGAYPAKVDDGPITFFVKTAKEKWVSNDLGLYEIEGIGLGFFCMKREIMQEIVDQSPTVWDDVLGGPRPSVFRVDTTDAGYKGTIGKFRSEDMAFCADILDLGYKIYLDPEVELGHVGVKVYKGSIKDALQVA